MGCRTRAGVAWQGPSTRGVCRVAARAGQHMQGCSSRSSLVRLAGQTPGPAVASPASSSAPCRGQTMVRATETVTPASLACTASWSRRSGLWWPLSSLHRRQLRPLRGAQATGPSNDQLTPPLPREPSSCSMNSEGAELCSVVPVCSGLGLCLEGVVEAGQAGLSPAGVSQAAQQPCAKARRAQCTG